MLKWLLPHEVNFVAYFEKQVNVLQRAALAINELLTNCNDIPSASKKIKELEHEADLIAHECIAELHKTFITPFQRDDIHRLVSRIDDIIDYIDEASARIVIYRLTTITDNAKELAQVLVKSSIELEKIFVQLRNPGKAGEMKNLFFAIHLLENEGDRIHAKAIGDLFDQYEDVKLIIKWKEIYEILEDAIDCCKDVSNVVEGVILEST